MPEDLFANHTLQLGPAAQLRITERIPRCRIVSLAPETAAADPAILRHLAQRHGSRAGIYARPLTPGTLAVGDPVYLLDTFPLDPNTAALERSRPWNR